MQESAVKIQALMVAIYILVTTRLAGTETAPDEYRQQRNLASEIVKDACRKDEPDVELSSVDIDNCMRAVKDQKWTHMDWFENITPGAGVGLDKRMEDDVQDGSDNDEADEGNFLPVTRKNIGSRDPPGQDYLQTGLGTMVKTCLPSMRFDSIS